MSAPLAFIDTETTGLDPDRHEVWECGLIVRADGRDVESHWFLEVDLGRADPYALKVGGFHERHPHGRNGGTQHTTPVRRFAEKLADSTVGCHLVGAVVSFDEERLRRLLRANGACPGWHYHLVDVENLAAGKLGVAPPWDSETLSRAVGVEPDDFDRHSALGDARWARAIYDAVVAEGSDD